jgi:hypothetical protein
VTATLRTTQLHAYEGIIKRGQKTFIEVGEALAKIREGKLYREAGYSSFEDYCRERWSMGRSYANQLIRTSELGEVGTTVPNFRQARALAQVAEPKRAEVMERVHAHAEQTGEPISARLITETALPLGLQRRSGISLEQRLRNRGRARRLRRGATSC